MTARNHDYRARVANPIVRIESDRVERTVSTKDTDKFAEAICAFSNDFPYHRRAGYLIIGCDDHGRPSGLQVTDQLLQNLAAIRSDGNVQPLPAVSVGKFTLPEGDLAVVEVLPSDLPPVRYKGRVWIRVGPRKAIASETEERILSERRTALSKTFDARPCSDSELEDLIADLFQITYRGNAVAPETIAENNRNLPEQLSALRFYDLNKKCPTHAGVLLFGHNPLHWLPGAYIQFLRFAGTELSDEVSNEQTFSGDLLTVLRELDAFIPLQIRAKPVPVSTLQENVEQDYPFVALREILMNAIMHRRYENSTSPIRFYWFEDRIEIQNPGGLYGEATPENFPLQNSYRNPIVAEAMKVLGYVNKYGRGIFRAQDALKKNGNAPAEFVFDANYVLVTIRRKT